MANVIGINTIYIDTTGILVSKPVVIHKILLNAAVSTASSLTLRDGGASGTIVCVLQADDADYTRELTFSPPIVCNTNLYVTIAGTGASALVLYKQTQAG